MLDRRQFASLAGASFGSLLTRKLWAEQARASASPDKFYFALVADTHIIDTFYVKGGENGVEDNESILVTTPRLTSARDLINSLNPAIEQVFLIGDYFTTTPLPITTSTSRTRRGSTMQRPLRMGLRCQFIWASATMIMTSAMCRAR